MFAHRTGRWVLLLAFLLTGTAGCRNESEPSRAGRRARRSEPELPVWQHPGGTTTAPASSASGPTSHPSTGPASRPDSPERMQVLARAEVGQWARYRLAGGFEQRLEVIDKTGREVRLKLEMWLAGQPTGLPAIRTEPVDVDWALRAAEQVRAQVTTRQTRLTAAGRTWQTRLTIARWTFEGVEYERRTWTAADAPLYGVVRMLMTTGDALTASMELVAFGASPRAEEASR